MRKTCAGIVDYGIGNHKSLQRVLQSLGFRSFISATPASLDDADVLFLPGVGAFPHAMHELEERNLSGYIRGMASKGCPIVGICLGMQLLADASYEGRFTRGLGLIPGEIVRLADPWWHIGWNTLRFTKVQPIFEAADDTDFYFNHSFVYRGPEQFQVAHAGAMRNIPAIIENRNVVGLQFHPEKSQAAGARLLKNLVAGLHRA